SRKGRSFLLSSTKILTTTAMIWLIAILLLVSFNQLLRVSGIATSLSGLDGRVHSLRPITIKCMRFIILSLKHLPNLARAHPLLSQMLILRMRFSVHIVDLGERILSSLVPDVNMFTPALIHLGSTSTSFDAMPPPSPLSPRFAHPPLTR
ncbi:hypothetical protein TorRG33x02_169480, partial [Trema orientale]